MKQGDVVEEKMTTGHSQDIKLKDRQQLLTQRLDKAVCELDSEQIKLIVDEIINDETLMYVKFVLEDNND